MYILKVVVVGKGKGEGGDASAFLFMDDAHARESHERKAFGYRIQYVCIVQYV